MNLQEHVNIVNAVEYRVDRKSGIWTAEVTHNRKRYSGRAQSKIRAAEICLEKIEKEERYARHT